MDHTILANGYSWLYALVNLQHAYMNVLPVVLLFARILASFHCFSVTNRETMNVLHGRIKDDWCMEYDDEMRPSGVVLHKPKRTGTYSDLLRPTRLVQCVCAHLPRYVVYKNGYDRVMYVYTTKWYMHNVLLRNDHLRQMSHIDLEPSSDLGANGHSLSLSKKEKNEQNEQKEKKEKNDDATPDATSVAAANECESHQVNYMCRTGDTHYVRYKVRKMNIVKYRFTPLQVDLYKRCIEHYNRHNATVVFLEGPVGMGKTCFAYLLANELNSAFVDAFNPTEPSDTFDNLYSSAEHSASRPLVVLLDEVDVLLQSVFDGVPLHKNCLTQVRNKTQWNTLLDKVQMGCYPNVIIVMCSNKSREDIDKQMDPSLLRNGRINLLFRMDVPRGG